MAMPEMTEKYFKSLAAQVATADAFTGSVLFNNATTASNSIRAYTTLSTEASAHLDEVLQRVSALARALSSFDTMGVAGEEAAEKVRDHANQEIARLGKLLATAEPSESARALGFG